MLEEYTFELGVHGDEDCAQFLYCNHRQKKGFRIVHHTKYAIGLFDAEVSKTGGEGVRCGLKLSECQFVAIRETAKDAISEFSGASLNQLHIGPRLPRKVFHRHPP